MSDRATRDAELRAMLDSYGDAWSDVGSFRRWEVDYLTKLRPTADDVPLLIEVAEEWLRWDLPEDQQPVFADDDVALYAPVHAWRCLGQMGAEEAIEPLVMMLDPMAAMEDDILLEMFPPALACFGAAAFDALDAVASDRLTNEWGRVAALSAMEYAVNRNPALQEDVVRRLKRQLECFDLDAPSFNASVIGSLVELGAKDAAPLIERAYEAGAIDEELDGTLEWVLYDLGLAEMPSTPRFKRTWSASGPAVQRGVDPRHELRAKKKRERKAKKRNRR
ncbi:MAG: hypothetical protein ACRCT8_17140 [Lacipirellulaceae bacterium]